MGVTGADVRDNMTSYYKMVCYGKVPVLIWAWIPGCCIDKPPLTSAPMWSCTTNFD
ncbi:MAG: hypothetical protein ACLTMA_06175 [Gemmiger formicilis]